MEYLLWFLEKGELLETRKEKHAENTYGRAMHLWSVACHFVMFQSCTSEEDMKRVKYSAWLQYNNLLGFPMLY